MTPEQTAQLDALEAQHGKCASSVIDGKLFAFRTPTLEEWEDHQERMVKATPRRGPAYREIAQICLVAPTLEELQKAFRARPGINVGIGEAIGELAVGGVEFTIKKD